MHTFLTRVDRTTCVGRSCCVVILAWLALGCVRPAFSAETTTTATKKASSLRLAPIAIRTSGSIGYDIEQRSTNGASPTLRQRVILNLRGKAITYISRPWLAQVKGSVNFSIAKHKTNDHSSSNHGISGNVGLYLVPYSHYPSSAVLSRNQNYSGHGFGSLTTESTRLDLTQDYAPRNGKERYRLAYNYTQSESATPEIYTSNGLNFNMVSNRFKHQTLKINGLRRRNKQRNADRSTLLNQATAEHRYLPSSEFSWDNNAILRNDSIDSPLERDRDRTREANSTLRYQPRAKAYSAIATARVHATDFDFSQGSSHSRIANANLSGVYRWSQHINLSASVNASVSDSNSQQSTNLSTTQSATTNYSLASFSVDDYHYNSRFGGSISNSTSTSRNRNSLGSPGNTVSVRSGSQQSISLSPSHSLSRNTLLNGGRLRIRFDQSLSIRESTRSQAIARLTHSATANWRRGISSLRLTGRDARSLNSNQDSFQFVNFNANISDDISRDSSISAYLSIQATRQINTGSSSSTSYTSSSASVHYGNRRTFGIPRMQFDSDLRAYSRSLAPVLASSPSEQGPVSWENILSYTVGKLSTNFKVTLSKENDGSSQSLIWLSLKRYF